MSESQQPGAALPEADGALGEAVNDEIDARLRAQRLGVEFVDVKDFTVDHDLFQSIPVELMFRYHFVPYRREGERLRIVVADPTNVLMIDELELLLGAPIDVAVGPRSAIQEILKRSESSQRVLDEATEQLRIQVVREDDEGEEVLSIDRITADESPAFSKPSDGRSTRPASPSCSPGRSPARIMGPGGPPWMWTS